jgi:hypothetical protein
MNRVTIKVGGALVGCLTGYLALLAPTQPAQAETKSRSVKSAASLLPRPFIAEAEYSVDLDRDRDLDVVVVGVDGPKVAPPDDASEALGDGTRLLLVARRDPDGFRTIGVGRSVLLCRRCGGAFWGLNATPVEVEIKANAFNLIQSSGSREVTDWVHRFRLEKGRVRLIGLDRSVTDRTGGSVVSVSTNYLTGLTITTVRGEPEEPATPGRVKRKPSVVLLDAVEIA